MEVIHDKTWYEKQWFLLRENYIPALQQWTKNDLDFQSRDGPGLLTHLGRRLR